MRSQPIVCALFFYLLFSLAASAPTQGQQGPPQSHDIGPGDADQAQQRLAREMAKKANLERQAALKADTDKLVKLTGELKGYVDKSNENMLSLEVVRKAEEIEKLARSVKEKMRGPN